MRSCFLLMILFCAAARANPVVPDPPLNAFIASEKLAVTIGPAEARLNGTFTFQITGNVSKAERALNTAELRIPVWFPAGSGQGSAIASFWKAIDQSQDSYLTEPASGKAIEQAVAMKVVAGGQPPKATDLVISGRGGYGYTLIPNTWRETGYHVLLFYFMVSPRIIDSGTPITISYRQPLRSAGGSRQFFYIPLFEHLPKSVSLSDTNRYCITLTAAPNCDLAVTNGLFRTRVKPGGSVNLSPKPLQAIRATVQLQADKSP
jgi:hypothetical protein